MIKATGFRIYNALKRYMDHIKLFLITLFVFIMALYLVSCIPYEIIDHNAREGRGYYYDKTYPLFKLLEKDNYGTYIDVAMDELMFDIAHNLGTDNESIFNPRGFSNVENVTVRYGRYWHGYAVLLRSLMIFLNKDQMVLFFDVVILLLAISLLISLYVKRHYIMTLLCVLAGCMTHFEVVFYCFEYMFCTILVLGFSLYMLWSKNMTLHKRYLLYFLTGMSVAYFDFLTFETLTFTLPMLIDILEHSDIDIRSYCISGVNWFLGYGLTFLAKFFILFFVIRDNDTAVYSVIKAYDKIQMVGYSVFDGVVNNFDVVMFSEYKGVWLIIIVIMLIEMYVLGFQCKNNVFVFITGLIPVLRLIVLSGQAASHFMFTYHALFTTIVSIGLICLSPLTYKTFDSMKYFCHNTNK